MKIEEAIELLQKDLDNPGSVPIEDLHQAQKLGIEALKRIQNQHDIAMEGGYTPLPGETK